MYVFHHCYCYRNHKSVMVIRRNQDVVGGITYRPFLRYHMFSLIYCHYHVKPVKILNLKFSDKTGVKRKFTGIVQRKVGIFLDLG